MSRLLVRTLREDPADADSAGHALLVRAGFVRRLASGVYTMLPLGQRVVTRIARVVREEQNRVGMQEILMPVLSPYEIWEESGRAALFGQDDLPAMTIEVRGGRFVLGPTHEEVATKLVAGEVDSYRQLPVTVYQVQTKFRDEARPRSGLLRGREFTMSDAYSFDASAASMADSYDRAVEAYRAIFARLGIEVVPVAAATGAMGGSVSHEWMVPSTIGEDYFASCPNCGAASNVEVALRAVAGEPVDPASVVAGDPEPVATPEAASIDAVAAMLSDHGVTPERILKSIAVRSAEGTVAIVVVPGHREARVPHGWHLFEDEDFRAHPHIVRGFIGPAGLEGVRVMADDSLSRSTHSYVAGANRPDEHVLNIVVGRDFIPDEWGSFAIVEGGDLCTNCGAAMELRRSVEAAHTFQLGLRYTTTMSGMTFVAEDGSEQPFWMGCYGLGVTRLLAVLAESRRDDDGLIWPGAVAPFDVTVLALGASRSPEVGENAERAVAALEAAGLEVLYDDRDVSAGVKFADADLIGVPLRVMIGAKGLARGVAEVKERASGETRDVALDDLLAGRLSA
jgi:prolyl-tRNA synthetase